MRNLLFLLCIVSAIFAQERPKIALVLSGGGARGGAHVGVLKVLQENRIPIDMIVGTSMGSFVGALYSAGMSPDEIATMLESTDWTKYIRPNFNRVDIPMQKKEIDYIYQGHVGVGVNTYGNFVLPTGILKREPLMLKFMQLTQNVQDIENFDNLSIPYRCIATDIKNGNAVVLKSGDLAKAIYASSAIPGGFEPVTIDGIDLVDGGVSDNLPIQVAKDMGADIIIAINVSEDFKKNRKINSYLIVLEQLVDIMMRKNVEESLALHSKKDIFITPDLNGYNGLDTSHYKEIILAGEKAAKKRLSSLTKLSISEEEYKKYVRKHRTKHIFQAPIIDKIVIHNSTYLSNSSIRGSIHQKVGEQLDLKQLREDLLYLYNMTLFDSVDYKISKKEEKTELIITTTPSWDSLGKVRFSIGLEDDFKGHSAYSFKLGYTKFGVNAYGGEWRNDFEIGHYKKIRTELFQPLESSQKYYIRPSLKYVITDDIFPLSLIEKDLDGNQEIKIGRYGGTFAFGTHITNDFEVEISLSSYKDSTIINNFPTAIPEKKPLAVLQSINWDYSARPLDITLKMDTLDDVNFPTKGFFGKIRWSKEMAILGSDYDYEQIYVGVKKPFNFNSGSLTFYGQYANTYKMDSVPRLAGTFMLGGLFNLSGYAPYSTIGDNLVLGVARYAYKIKGSSFFGTLDSALYTGFSLEVGDTWDGGTSFNYAKLKKSASIYFAIDTFLGPFYLAYGSSAGGEHSAYLYLGEKF